jgi:hypothetical protein
MIGPTHRLRSTFDVPPRATTPDASPLLSSPLLSSPRCRSSRALKTWETDRGIQKFVFGMLDFQCDKGVLDRMGTTNVTGVRQPCRSAAEQKRHAENHSKL